MPATKEKTRAQSRTISTAFTDDIQSLSRSYKMLSYADARTMREDPTISMGRWLVSAPIVGSTWGYEKTDKAPEGALELIKEELEPQRMHLLQKVMYDFIDYGWSPYEMIFKNRDDNMWGIKKLKSLLVDFTEIQVFTDGSGYAGLIQTKDGQEVDLSPQETLCFSFEPEGDDLYGRPLLQNIRTTYCSWEEVESAAKRYDKKLAGTHLIIKYPKGTSMFMGEQTDNFVIAEAVAKKFQSAGVTIMPAKGDSGLDDADAATNGEWDVTFVSPGGGDGGFVNRQKYLDALKVRGLGLPERAVLEGQFGTKAEAEAHADFAILNMELRHQFIVMTVNNHLVNRLLKFNFGKKFENTVKIVPSPIGDAGKSFLREVYKNIIANPEGAMYEMERIDFNALREQVGIPKRPEDEDGPFSDNRVAMQNQPGVAAMLAAVAGGTMSPVVAKLLLVKTYGLNAADVEMMIQTTKKLPKPQAPGMPM